MEADRIAVVVPVYNRRHSVIEALESIAAQSLSPDRVLVVDDGSTDGSGAAVAEWLRRPWPFESQLIVQENQGVSAARNRALASPLDCPLVAFLDSDDLWPNDFLSRMRTALSNHPTAVAATCDRLQQDCGDGSQDLEDLAELGRDAVRWLLLNDGGIASATLFRTSRLLELGGFREDLRTAEDLDLFFRLSLRGPWLHVDELAVTFRRGLAAQRGEASNLSLHYDDKFRRTARVYEEFVVHQGGDRVLERSLYRRVLSRWWYLAGRELWQAGQVAEARDCFRRSTRWRRWNKAWLKLGQTYLARAA
jgi:glycosyltransferase involved in cell wall biosynthesis